MGVPLPTWAAPARLSIAARRLGEHGTCYASLKNSRNYWVSDQRNQLTQPLMEKIAGTDRRTALPAYHGRTFAMRAKRSAPPVDRAHMAAFPEPVRATLAEDFD